MDSDPTFSVDAHVTSARIRLGEFSLQMLDDADRITDPEVHSLFITTARLLSSLDEAFDVAQKKLLSTRTTTPVGDDRG